MSQEDSCVQPEQLQPLNIEIPPVAGPSSPKHSPRTTRSKAAFTMAEREIDLSILLKFIKPYNGNRETLNSFLVNCNNAFDMASEAQASILFKYILSQLEGKAEIACSIKEFSSWDQLKEFLKTQFSERKHYSHLLMDLQESKQGSNENCSQYALRVETCLSQLLTEVSLSTTKKMELPGRTAAMNDLAMHHFVMGLHPRISNIVRCRNPKNLNEAVNLAISEERIQQSLYKKAPSNDQKMSNRVSSKPRHNPGSSTSYTPGTSASSGTVCHYCKTPGHSIKDCKKREYNNRQRDPDSKPPFTPFKRINHVEEAPDEETEEEEEEQEEYDYEDTDDDPKNE
ncbi:hypothetical protein ABMA27_006821 [Loxostege sticticalis]|uniref:Retrotransposon gag domain-containing protein n=1 Tax=Loxostege sticticalis TaxID=481309 RepID=A0ABR3IKK1_LOXSC